MVKLLPPVSANFYIRVTRNLVSFDVEFISFLLPIREFASFINKTFLAIRIILTTGKCY